MGKIPEKFLRGLRERYADQKLPSLRIIRQFQRASWGLPLRALPEDELGRIYRELDGNEFSPDTKQLIDESEAWLYEHHNEPELLGGMPSNMLSDFVVDYEHRVVNAG